MLKNVTDGLARHTCDSAASDQCSRFSGEQRRRLGHTGATRDEPFSGAKQCDLGAGPKNLANRSRRSKVSGVVSVSGALILHPTMIRAAEIVAMHRVHRRARGGITHVADSERERVLRPAQTREGLVPRSGRQGSRSGGMSG